MRDRDGFTEVCFPLAEAEVAFHRESEIAEEEDSGVRWGRSTQLRVHAHCSVKPWTTWSMAREGFLRLGPSPALGSCASQSPARGLPSSACAFPVMSICGRMFDHIVYRASICLLWLSRGPRCASVSSGLLTGRGQPRAGLCAPSLAQAHTPGPGHAG